MRHLIATLCLLICVSATSNAFAGECDSVNKYANTILDKYEESCKENCDNRAGRVAAAKEMVKFWNSMAGNSWAKIGPRHFLFGVTTKGTIQSVGKRTWVSSAPTEEATADVSISKTDGKGAIRYNICVMDPATKKIMRVGYGDFDKGKDTERQIKKVSNTAGKFVIVELIGESVTKAFAYELNVK